MFKKGKKIFNSPLENRKGLAVVAGLKAIGGKLFSDFEDKKFQVKP